MNAPAEERGILQRLAASLVDRGVDAAYQEWTRGRSTYRCVALNGRGRRDNDDAVWHYATGEPLAGERLARAVLVWGHRFEHRVAAEPTQAAAEAIAAQALARAAELRHQRGGAR